MLSFPKDLKGPLVISFLSTKGLVMGFRYLAVNLVYSLANLFSSMASLTSSAL